MQKKTHKEILLEDLLKLDLTPEEVAQIIECQGEADKIKDLNEKVTNHSATVDELYLFIEIFKAFEFLQLQ